MLTFFDYLRQRAFESVMAGAQEALALLESQKNRTEPPEHDAALPAPGSTSHVGPAHEPVVTAGPQEFRQPDDEKLPAPRKRGRPDRKPKDRA